MIARREDKRLPLGNILATPEALRVIGEADDTPTDFLNRHSVGDWGIVSSEDAQANDDALLHGERVLSAYRTALGVKLWIITEADRSTTTILLSSEY